MLNIKMNGTKHKMCAKLGGVLPNHRGKNIGGQSSTIAMRYRPKVKLSEIISLTKYKIK